MPLAQLPAIDVNICSGWTQQNKDMYNRLDFFLAKMQIERRKTWMSYRPLLGTRRWQPNMGPKMRLVTKEPSPHIRQFAFPQAIHTGTPKKDVIDVRERSQDELVYRHRFESTVLNFIPDFTDFMKDHVDACSTDIMEKQERFEDIFYRGRILHAAPYVYVPGEVGTTAAPTGIGNAAGTDGKSTAFIQQLIPQIGANGYVSMESLNMLLTIMENDMRVPPFSGSDTPSGESGMAGKYVYLCSSETFNQFTFDPWLLANKNCNLDVVNGRFQGSLFGRITCRLEDRPLRAKVDGTFAAPEVRELNPEAYNYGESIPNPVYTSLEDTGSPIAISMLCGGQGYEVLEVGPPPSKFAGSGMPKGFGKMFWNGEIELTKNFLVPGVDDDGNVVWETNQYGEDLKFISQVTYGFVRKQTRNIIPIFSKRKRGQ
jgi:hypothetical protein